MKKIIMAMFLTLTVQVYASIFTHKITLTNNLNKVVEITVTRVGCGGDVYRILQPAGQAGSSTHFDTDCSISRATGYAGDSLHPIHHTLVNPIELNPYLPGIWTGDATLYIGPGEGGHPSIYRK